MLNSKTIAEELTFDKINFLSKLQTIYFILASQAATTVLIQPLVLNASQAMFWTQITIVSDVDPCALHVYKQVLKYVNNVYLDFI